MKATYEAVDVLVTERERQTDRQIERQRDLQLHFIEELCASVSYNLWRYFVIKIQSEKEVFSILVFPEKFTQALNTTKSICYSSGNEMVARYFVHSVHFL